MKPFRRSGRCVHSRAAARGGAPPGLGVVRFGAMLILGASSLGVAGCGFVEELLNMRPLEVVAYHPSSESVSPESVEEIWVEFSAEMERSLTENAFSLSEGGEVEEGRFAWSSGGRRLSFRPATPVRAARSYTLRVTTGAEDLYGNSLNRELSLAFSTGSESVSPRVLSFFPADGAIISEPLSALEIEFSEAMERESFYRAFSITPEIAAAISWAPGDTAVTVIPVAPYAPGIDYEARLNPAATDTSGNPLPDSLVIGFRLPAEEPLEVSSVVRDADGAALSDEYVLFLNTLPVEKDDRFRITFSASVPIDRRPGIVTLTPAVSAQLSWDPGGGSVLLTPGEQMVWMELYELTVVESRYRFRVTGEGSRPPRIEDAYFSPSLSASPFTLLTLGDNMDFVTSADSAIDIVVSHSAVATLSLASAMEAVDLGISQGAPISFTMRDVQLSGSHPQGGPLPPGQSVIRLLLETEADIPGGGIVALEIDRNLADSRGNSLPVAWRVEVNGF